MSTSTAIRFNQEMTRNFFRDIEATALQAKDYKFATNHHDVIFTINEANRLTTRLNTEKHFTFNDHAEKQFAAKLDIMPHRNLRDIMRLAPRETEALIDRVVDVQPHNVMLRTLGDTARAFVSNKYNPIDNYDIAKAILPIIGERDLQVIDGALTDLRMYMKIIIPGLTRVVPAPEGHSRLVDRIVGGGIMISNSEVGAGAVNVEYFIDEHVCTNGLIVESMLRRIHVGKNGGNGEDGFAEYYRDDTRRAIDDAFVMRLRDIIGAATLPAMLDKHVSRLTTARTDEITGDIETVVNNVAAKYNLIEDERTATFRAFCHDGDLSRYGVIQSLTSMAQDRPYDRRVDIERGAASLLDLTPQQWISLNTKQSEN